MVIIIIDVGMWVTLFRVIQISTSKRVVGGDFPISKNVNNLEKRSTPKGVNYPPAWERPIARFNPLSVSSNKYQLEIRNTG